MLRIVAYAGTDSQLASHVLSGLRTELELPLTGESSGFGMGWIQDKRSLLRTNPKPSSNEPVLMDLMADLPARAMLGYIREVGSPRVKAVDLQPFRFRRWVFAHEGESPLSEETRESLLEDVPHFIRSNIKGTTFSEVAFHACLSALRDRNQLEGTKLNHEEVAQAMAQTVGKIEQVGAVADFRAVAVTRKTLVCARLGRPLYYKFIRGLEVADKAPMFAGHRPRKAQHPAFRAVAVANFSGEPGQDWEAVPDRSVMWIDQDWRAHFVSI